MRSTLEEDTQEAYCSNDKLDLPNIPLDNGHSCIERKWNLAGRIAFFLLLISGAWLLVFILFRPSLDGLEFDQKIWDVYEKRVQIVCTFISFYFNPIKDHNTMSKCILSVLFCLAVPDVVCRPFHGLQSLFR